MSDDLVRTLATKAGFSVHWVDQSGQDKTVSIESLRRLLAALGLRCGSAAEAKAASRRLDEIAGAPAPLVTADVNEPFEVDAAPGAPARLIREDGEIFEVVLGEAADGRGLMRPILEPGYHRLELPLGAATVAVAPAHGRSILDAGGGRRMWGLATQVYGLRRKGDGGIGDLGAVAALAESAARTGADAIALSPLHAGFTADPHHFGPYSPSSRLFLNPLHADPAFLFGEDRVQAAIDASGTAAARARQERSQLIDWPAAAEAKLSGVRRLFESFRSVELSAASPDFLATDFEAFRREGGALLQQHARFEMLHQLSLSRGGPWSWRDWPAELRDPESQATLDLARENAGEVEFHLFLQWVADRSLAAAQKAAVDAGMSIGLISDMAVGMDSGGSHAWSRQSDILVGLSVGSPPDLFNPNGQAWGLATFSPIALRASGFAPFLATLRACMKNAGGVRIDHVMGLARLWVAPEGEDAREGAYLAFPVEDMLRLIALESLRNDAVVVGEDLGTVPFGFRETLTSRGVAGMRVLQFEQEGGRFLPPEAYPAEALAMTTTHDLPTMAGWWSGADIELRASIGGTQFGETQDNDREARARDRAALWRAFQDAGAANGEAPAADAPAPVVDASVAFLSATPSALLLLPMEDAIAAVEQPNLPGTRDEHPNWRRRLPKPAPELLAEPAVAARLETLRRGRPK